MKQAQTRTARLRRANCATLREERREFLGAAFYATIQQWHDDLCAGVNALAARKQVPTEEERVMLKADKAVIGTLRTMLAG